ncbi:hypothetical protein CV770_40375 [Bradyrhizobium sp. AC87j1]|nr:hypothetical protein CV770_40375 [Bradyrhizobium sp. AC87j1]
MKVETPRRNTGRFATRCDFERCVMLLYIYTVIMIESWLDFWLTAAQRFGLGVLTVSKILF